MPEEPELLVEGVLVSAGGVDGLVDGELMGADLEASSTFLPQAPSANNAESASTVAAGLNWTEFMGFPFKNGWKEAQRSSNLQKLRFVADETRAYRLVGIFRRRDCKPASVCYIGSGVGCTSPGSGGVDRGCTGSGGGTLGLVAMDLLITVKGKNALQSAFKCVGRC